MEYKEKSSNKELFSKANYVINAVSGILKKKQYCTVGIDGKCASGKTTVGKFLSSYFDADLICADDYFLPENMKTPERLKEPGGNFDYGRFASEIIPNLKLHCPFSYYAYNCHTGKLTEKKANGTRVTIVEGSYCLRPDFSEIYDLKIFFDINNEEQIKRLEMRNPDLLTRFIGEWIPMENHYFKVFGIKESADLIIDWNLSFPREE